MELVVIVIVGGLVVLVGWWIGAAVHLFGKPSKKSQAESAAWIAKFDADQREFNIQRAQDAIAIQREAERRESLKAE